MIQKTEIIRRYGEKIVSETKDMSAEDLNKLVVKLTSSQHDITDVYVVSVLAHIGLAVLNSSNFE